MAYIGERKINKKYNKETIIKAIQQFVKENNKIPVRRDFDKTNGKYPSYATVVRHFGSWNKTIEAADLIFCNKKLDKKIIIKAIQQFYKENNRIPQERDFEKTKGKYPSDRAVRNYFGSWNKGIEAAGFKSSKHIWSRIWNKENIIESIQKYYKENKRIPRMRDFTNSKYPSFTTVRNYFNSWNKGIEAAGFEPNISMYGTQTKANDGIIYRSISEAEFVNKFLYDKYEYEIEPRYPSPYNRYYDWYIPKLDLYIELDGEIRPHVTREKIEINKLLNRKLLVIKTKDINKYNILEEIMY